MRKIGIRQLNRELYKEVDNLPFILTRDKKPYALVVKIPEDLKDIHNSSVYLVDNSQLEIVKSEIPHLPSTLVAGKFGKPIFFNREISDRRLNGTALNPDAELSQHFELRKPSFVQRLKSILSHKVF